MLFAAEGNVGPNYTFLGVDIHLSFSVLKQMLRGVSKTNLKLLLNFQTFFFQLIDFPFWEVKDETSLFEKSVTFHYNVCTIPFSLTLSGIKQPILKGNLI